MQDLIRVSIADPAETARIGQGTFQRVIFREQARSKLLEGRIQNLEPTGIGLCHLCAGREDVQRGAPLGSGYCERKGAAITHESGQCGTSYYGGGRQPMKPAGNHQMNYETMIALECV